MLYLDADTLALDDVARLWAVDMAGAPLMAMPGRARPWAACGFRPSGSGLAAGGALPQLRRAADGPRGVARRGAPLEGGQLPAPLPRQGGTLGPGRHQCRAHQVAGASWTGVGTGG